MLTPFGEWVRAFRDKNGITLREMASALGKSPSFLSALELGRKSVPSAMTDEIGQYYRLDVSELQKLKEAVTESKTYSKVKFEDRVSASNREVAMLFARNFDVMTEDQAERIKRILEERDVNSKR
jgi:HTH-type transcriptional regulator, competence development regulator